MSALRPRWLPSSTLELSPCGRFAPTPTGELHVGNAYTALLAHLTARRLGYQSVVRIDDLEPRPTSAPCAERQLDDLAWLGLVYDESPRHTSQHLSELSRGPYYQGQRAELYSEALAYLNERGLLYACHCSRRELAALAPHDSDEGVIYPGTCRPSASPTDRAPLNLSALPPHPTTGLAPSLRFDLEGAVNTGLLPPTLTFHDEVMGPQRFELSTGVGDFVVRRRDEVYAYQLACIVDDITQRCAFVLRGADLLTSTARQLALAACLDTPHELTPRYAHIGLVVDEQGERLAKRNRSCQLSGLREAGVSPEALRESLSRAWGAPSPSADLDQLADQLDISALPKTPVRWSLSQE